MNTRKVWESEIAIEIFSYIKFQKKGVIEPTNPKIQKIVDLLGTKILPLALTIKQGSLFNNDELAAMFDGVSLQQSEEN